MYQTAEQAHQHRQVLLERRGAEMLVHLVEAGQHRAEVVRADREHGREADRRIHRIAAADPVPEAEHVGGVDAELRDFLGVGRDGDEVLGDRGLRRRPGRPATSRARVCALVMVSSVVKVLEEMMNSVSAGVEIAHRLGEIGAIDVGDEAERHARARCSASAPRRP